MSPLQVPRARIAPPRARWLAFAPGVAMTAWAATSARSIQGGGGTRGLCFGSLLLAACFLLGAARDRPIPRPSRLACQELDALTDVAIVPVFNEDPDALRNCLESLLAQTRPLEGIVVVDDGSDAVDYAALSTRFERLAARRGTQASWVRAEHAGKRHAHAIAIRRRSDADVYLLVDSDTVLDPAATREAMFGFADARVQSVVPVILAHNYGRNLLTRTSELMLAVQQLSERSVLSLTGSILINSGAAAYYRATVLHDHVETYVGETFRGRPVTFSDDSLLTLFALRRGRTVHQTTAFAFTDVPERLDHYRRQQLRWMRGSVIRSLWRFRYLPLDRVGYWIHLVKWVQYVVISIVLILIVLTAAHPTLHFLLWLAIVNVGLGLLLNGRYLTLQRSDQTLMEQLGVYLLAPLVPIWNGILMRPLRWWAFMTVMRLEWGTRRAVEISER